jgi:spore germination protein GerM
MPELEDVIREIALHSNQTDAALKTAAKPLAGGPRTLLLTFPIGANVLDLVTGEKGVVIDGKRENVVISTSTTPGN